MKPHEVYALSQKAQMKIIKEMPREVNFQAIKIIEDVSWVAPFFITKETIEYQTGSTQYYDEHGRIGED